MTDEKAYYKLIISYRGTHYCGWQFQTAKPNSIQNQLQMVLSKIVKHKKFQVIGASRTDSGVHASGQVVKLVLPRNICPINLQKGMNSKLPKDIRVLACEFTKQNFNVNLDAKLKEYHYYFTINQSENALRNELITNLNGKFQVDLMRQACDKIIGEHNFISFTNPGPNIKRTHRKINRCTLEKTSFLASRDEIYFLKIQGNGFFTYMIRYLMGAIWDIGTGDLTLEELSLSLATGQKIGPRFKAPARGLHLIHIEY
jgi:tRNA pseudouridine38-40 synthase